MPWNPLSDSAIRCLEKSLDLQSRRQEIIAANIANLDTPGYTGKEMDFSAVLQAHLQGRTPLTLAVTHPRHLTGPKPGISPMVRDTGKPVDLDQEMVLLSRNQLAYQASVQMLNKKLEQLKTSMEGGTR